MRLTLPRETVRYYVYEKISRQRYCHTITSSERQARQLCEKLRREDKNPKKFYIERAVSRRELLV